MIVLKKSSESKSAVIWLTGLPGSGKTTISNALCRRLQSLGNKVEPLDGDVIRNLFPRTGFTRQDRDEHVHRVAHLASLLEKHDVFCVVSLISPYADARKFARSICGRFVEVYLSTPLKECERRDPKGLYAKARKGVIKNFTGLDDPYEIPETPELVINTEETSLDQSVSQILDALRHLGKAASTR
jgi:adenylylsulfate kinase